MIDPNTINTVRVGQLVEEIWSGTDNLPHEVGTDLRRGTVASLANYIAGVIDSSAGLAFNPLSISDGQSLPVTTINEWVIVGEGTYLQPNGFPDVVCTGDINIVLSNSVSWSLGFGIEVEGVDSSQFVKLTTNQTIDGVKTFVQPIIIPDATSDNEAVNLGQIIDKITYKSKSTYALMIADGTPNVPTMYSITNDENKDYERSTYLWKPDGNREWIATTPDN